jgi:hypothetical protein
MATKVPVPPSVTTKRIRFTAKQNKDLWKVYEENVGGYVPNEHYISCMVQRGYTEKQAVKLIEKYIEKYGSFGCYNFYENRAKNNN